LGIGRKIVLGGRKGLTSGTGKTTRGNGGGNREYVQGKGGGLEEPLRKKEETGKKKKRPHC